MPIVQKACHRLRSVVTRVVSNTLRRPWWRLQGMLIGPVGRDFDQLQRVGIALLGRHTDVRMTIVAAAHAEAPARMPALAVHERVEFLTGISDEQLLELYRRAVVLLLPMRASGANNAVVEALACGLPIVTDDVGGIRDYGGGTFFPIVGSNDDEAMIEETLGLLNDEARRKQIADNVRQFAVERLEWRQVAEQHRRCYEEFAQ